MPFLITYWKQIAVTVTVVLAFSFGYYKGYSNQKVKFDAFKMQVEVNAKIQKDKNELLIKKQKQVSENITKEYANAVKKLNAYYASHRVYINSSVGRVSEVSKATSSVDGETESDISNSTGNSTLDCASDVLQLLYLQKWIEDQLLIQ